jgi:hypothetical protein
MDDLTFKWKEYLRRCLILKIKINAIINILTVNRFPHEFQSDF